jgi:hypothetical protein
VNTALGHHAEVGVITRVEPTVNRTRPIPRPKGMIEYR